MSILFGNPESASRLNTILTPLFDNTLIVIKEESHLKSNSNHEYPRRP